MLQIRHLCKVVRRLLFLRDNLPPANIRLESLVEVEQAHTTISDREDNEDNGQHRKNRKRRSCSVVLRPVTWLVNAHELEEEVCECSDVKADGGDHASFDFLAGPNRSESQNNDCDRDGGDGEVEFGVGDIGYDDQELNGETEEEVEIELKKGDINLEAVSEKF